MASFGDKNQEWQFYQEPHTVVRHGFFWGQKLRTAIFTNTLSYCHLASVLLGTNIKNGNFYPDFPILSSGMTSVWDKNQEWKFYQDSPVLLSGVGFFWDEKLVYAVIQNVLKM
jgi:hypothetical protein